MLLCQATGLHGQSASHKYSTLHFCLIRPYAKAVRQGLEGWAHLEELKEFALRRGQRGVCQHFEQVAKVIAAVEGYPLHLLSTYTGSLLRRTVEIWSYP